jgi:hypothetical protein
VVFFFEKIKKYNVFQWWPKYWFQNIIKRTHYSRDYAVLIYLKSKWIIVMNFCGYFSSFYFHSNRIKDCIIILFGIFCLLFEVEKWNVPDIESPIFMDFWIEKNGKSRADGKSVKILKLQSSNLNNRNVSDSTAHEHTR